MLMQALRRAALVIAAVVVVTGSWQTAANAKGNPPGGGFGGTQCGQSYTPGCTVTVGTPGSGGTGGPGTGGQGPGGGTLTVGTGPGSGCAGTMSKAFGCVPAGCTITVQTLACPIGVAGPPGAAALRCPRHRRCWPGSRCGTCGCPIR